MQNQNRSVVGRVLLAVTLFWFAHYVFVPYFTPHLSTLGVTSTTIGAIVGTYGFSQLLLRIPFGILADRLHSQKLFMLFGFVCLLIAGFTLRLAAHPAAFLVGRFLAGVSASTWVNYTVFYSGLFPKEATGKAMGTIMACNNLGTMLAYAFGMLFFDNMGIRSLFLVSIVVATLGFLLLLTVPERRDLESVPMRPADIALVARNKDLLLHAGLSALMQIVTFATAMSFTANHAKSLGAEGFELGLLLILFSAAGMFGSLWTGSALRRRIPDSLHIAIAFGLMAIYCVVIPNSDSMLGIYSAQLFGGLGRSIVMALTMSHAISTAPVHLRSTAMGTYQSIYGLGMTIGPLLMGVMLDWSEQPSIAFYCIGLISLIGTAIGFFALRSRERVRSADTISK